MDLSEAPESGNVQDMRGMKTAGGVIGGGAGILILILGLIFGVDFNRLGITGGGGGGGPPPNDKYKEFAAKVVGTLEVVWTKEFANPRNRYPVSRYEKPRLVLFSSAVRTGCGTAQSDVGPFYCPADDTMYLDPTFFRELSERLRGSAAEFSQAYVIAHENGHHVQNLLGFNKKVGRNDKAGSIRLELQADYLAGVWAYHGQKEFHFIQRGDIDSAITTARAIGDDRLQERGRGYVNPREFTHGTSRQRIAAFTAGYRTGDATMEKLDQFFRVRISGNGELDDSVFE
ncbi:MAG TPA: neutral zinc metallopeptidase [Gemmata sp.]|nr:neutral zinc metallopeptidase [Gemmata sp.]